MLNSIMGDEANWDKLPCELLIVIVQKLRLCQDLERFSAVSKYWKSVNSGLGQDEKPLLPPESPHLFLAEQVAEGALLSCDFNNDEDEDVDYDVEDYDEACYEEYLAYDYGKHSVGNTRGLYSLSTRKTYYIDLPEASGRLIFGTNKGWLLTLGRDLQINLLHPFSRQQIPLPPLNTFPESKIMTVSPVEPSMLANAFDILIRKVAMSSEPRPKKNAATPNPIVMVIYGECSFLGYARLGEKSWTNVNISSRRFYDIAFYQGKFYAIDCHGDVFVCDIDDDSGAEQIKGTKIASCPPKPESGDFDMKYLVESHSGLWLVERFLKISCRDKSDGPHNMCGELLNISGDNGSCQLISLLIFRTVRIRLVNKIILYFIKQFEQVQAISTATTAPSQICSEAMTLPNAGLPYFHISII
ncbi:hypothetical protein ACET3Z_025625 [Daucus carota]